MNTHIYNIIQNNKDIDHINDKISINKMRLEELESEISEKLKKIKEDTFNFKYSMFNDHPNIIEMINSNYFNENEIKL